MRINTTNNSAFKRVIAGLVALIMVMALAGCASSEHREMMQYQSTDASGDLTGADIMFLQMMIPHHQQAIDISDLALTKSADSELLALAKSIRDEQAAEIVKMKAWLEEANASSHSDSHSMDGMLSDAELAALDKASGKSFDVLWLKAMTGHHTGAIDMASMLNDSNNDELIFFGQGIVASQSAQNKAMAAMIKRFG